MNQAMLVNNQCLMGTLDQQGRLQFCNDPDSMPGLVEDSPNPVWIINQHEDAQQWIETHPPADGQEVIEIFQDTEGVFGLRAYQQIGKMQTPAVLELGDPTV